MKDLIHCGKPRRTLAYRLLPECPDSLRWDIFLEAWCPRCQKTVQAVYSTQPGQEDTPVRRVRPNQLAYWQQRLKTDLCDAQWIDQARERKQTRLMIHVGEYSARAAGDPARIHGYILGVERLRRQEHSAGTAKRYREGM